MRIVIANEVKALELQIHRLLGQVDVYTMLLSHGVEYIDTPVQDASTTESVPTDQ